MPATVTSEPAASEPLEGSAPGSEGEGTGDQATSATTAERSTDVVSQDATVVDSADSSREPPAPSSSDVTDPCGASLLLNGDFEAGATHWTASSTYGAFEERVHPLIVSSDHESLTPYGVQAQEGSQLAFLGDVPDDEYMGYRVSLRQPVTLGPGVTGLLLRGYLWVDTEEDPDAEYDYAYVQLESPDASEDFFQLQFWTNLDATQGWVPLEEYLPVTSALLERELLFVVEARSDAKTPTRFWFDALELVTDCE